MTKLFKLNAPLGRNTRRKLVLVTLTMLALYIVLGLFSDRFFLESMLPFALYWLLLIRLNRSTSRIVSEKDKNLDERQQGRRNQAYRLAYKIAVYLALAIFLFDTFSPTFQIDFYNGNLSVTSLLILVNALLIVFLPTMYVAWLEPDPPAEETPQSAYGKERAL